MRITFLSPPPNLSGGERVVAIYTRELTARGHEVKVICERPPRITLRKKISSFLTGKGWPRQLKIAASHYENYGVCFKVVDHYGPLSDYDIPDGDAVVATMWYTANWTQSLSAEKGQKFYLVQHDEGTIFKHLGAERTYSYRLRHIYVSNWIAGRIRERHPTVEGIIIPNAVEFDLFDFGSRKKPTKMRLGMMWAGDAMKGGDIAIRAVCRARERGLDVELVAFGEIYPPERYASEINEFCFQPKHEELVNIYGLCTAWLFTSRFEGFGLPILEAMAAGTPVIGTATGAAPELISQGGGILVPREDLNSTVDAIEYFHDMPSEVWQTISEAARRTAGFHSWDAAVSDLERYLVAHVRI